MKKLRCAALTAVMAFTFTACTPVPGAPARPFGETHYTNDKAKPAYERFTERLLTENLADWTGYTISITTPSIDNPDIDLYHTEEYTIAYAEGRGEYLWYEGMLFYSYGETLTCREMPWETLGGEPAAAQMWNYAMQLAALENAELEYKHIPMANGRAYRLQADYPATLLTDGRMVTPRLAVRLDGDGTFESFTVSWQYVGDREDLLDNIECSVSFYTFAGSTDLQAERKIWSFGQKQSLTEQGVFALTEQSESREICREIIQSMDFEGLASRTVHDDSLAFPSFSTGETASDTTE